MSMMLWFRRPSPIAQPRAPNSIIAPPPLTNDASSLSRSACPPSHPPLSPPRFCFWPLFHPRPRSSPGLPSLHSSALPFHLLLASTFRPPLYCTLLSPSP